MSNRTTLNSYIRANHLNLVGALDELAQFIRNNVAHLYLAKLPVNKLGDEKEIPKSIELVEIFREVNEDSKRHLYQSLTRIEINPFSENTYLAKRYPGYVVLPEHCKPEFLRLNEQVNLQREIFKLSVKKGFNNRQSIHENLHELLPNLVLLSATRTLKVVHEDLDEITSVNFYWQIKRMKKHVKHKSAEKMIMDSLNAKPIECFGLTKDELIARKDKELDLLSRVPSSSKIVEIRYARVQPFVDVWGKNENETRSSKALNSHATLPVILFKPPAVTNELKNYTYTAPAPINLPVLNARKHWYILQ